MAAELRSRGAQVGEAVRVVSLDVKAGVTSDEGPGDAWPALRPQVLDAQTVVLGTPSWLGLPSSVAQRALERLAVEVLVVDALHGPPQKPTSDGPWNSSAATW